ncbi:unnamed protein product [Microthlaspi erraticum]|uniref:Uncharacterized protein n=1 Tax=Microthlaspi erraticum TaxID=1685480 RepID=A0A6D2KHP1_9BRAS|nr:unnamed protein product [Microthlaspi erraticum]
MEQKESNHQVPKSRAPNLHFSLKTKPEHPKYDRIFMPSRRPKVMILIWKDRYLSHDPRRSGKRGPRPRPRPWLVLTLDLTQSRKLPLARTRPIQELGEQAQAAKEKWKLSSSWRAQLCRPRPALYLYILAFSLL